MLKNKHPKKSDLRAVKIKYPNADVNFRTKIDEFIDF